MASELFIQWYLYVVLTAITQTRFRPLARLRLILDVALCY